MAQTNFTPISLYYSTTAAAVPTAGNLVAGELAINTQDGKLFYKDAAGVVQTIASKDINSGVFPAGTVSAPSITFTGDTNTGIYSPAADTIAFTEGGVESMRLDSSGRLGIGTSSPSTRLTINAAYTSSRGQLSIVGASDEAGLSFYNDSTFNGIVNFSNSSGYLGTVSNTPLFFSTNNAERMRITSAGNVLIGTTTSAAPLTVIKSVTSDNLLYFQNTNTSAGTSFGITLAAGTNSSDYALKIINAAASSELMRVDGAGNVGIGISSPTAKLDVLTSSTTAEMNLRAWGQSTTTTNAINFWYLDAGGTPYNNTSIRSLSAANAGNGSLVFYTRPTSGSLTEAMRIDSNGNVGIGGSVGWDTGSGLRIDRIDAPASIRLQQTGTGASGFEISAVNGNAQFDYRTGSLKFAFEGNERARINSTGAFMVGKTDNAFTTAGADMQADGEIRGSRNNAPCLSLNRLTGDGVLVQFFQDTVLEGNISVSGTTVSYNGGHLSRWSQLPDGSKDETLLKGTVLSNLDDMCVWEKNGEILSNEQLNKMKVSNVEGDTNVAGVFVSWQFDEQCQSDDMNVAMTGDMIIRIADGVVVQKGDLLMSAGDGTAKPQGDDIVRSKTIAKVTSNYVTCTYADGSYCVPCVLMAC